MSSFGLLSFFLFTHGRPQTGFFSFTRPISPSSRLAFFRLDLSDSSFSDSSFSYSPFSNSTVGVDFFRLDLSDSTFTTRPFRLAFFQTRSFRLNSSDSPFSVSPFCLTRLLQLDNPHSTLSDPPHLYGHLLL